MNTNLLIIFIALNVVNVIIQTVKTIATVKCGKTVAAIVNAVTYALYTVVLVYTMCDLPLWAKATIVGLCNLVGVWIVKFCEEKARKDKLWKIEATVLRGHTQSLRSALDRVDIPHNYLENVGPYTLFNIYCKTQAQSARAKEVMKEYDAKYFVSESKTL